MSVIQAVSYPVSAVLQSQQQIPPRDSAASPAAPRPSAAPAPVSTDLAAVSSRVSAFVAIEQSAATARSRPDQAEPEATETAGSGADAVDLDEAQIYQPVSMY